MEHSLHQVLHQLATSGYERGVRLSSLGKQLWADNIILGLNLAFLGFYFLLQLWKWYASELTDSLPASRSRLSIRNKSGLVWIGAISCCLFLLSLDFGVLIFTTYNSWPWQTHLSQVVSAIALITMWKELLVIRRQGRQTFSPILRAWWITAFPLVVLSVSRSVIAFTTDSSIPWTSWVDIASFPACLVLFSAGLVGTSGVQAEAENSLRDPLLCNHEETVPVPLEENVSQYRNVGFISRLTFSWLNPLLATGARKPLELRDIPLQPKEDRTGPTHSRLKSTWDRFQDEKSGETPSLFKVLLATFWKETLYTGILYALILPVNMVGPVLIEYVVEYLGGETHFSYEGYVLPLCLLSAKIIESIATRHQTVECESLGLQAQLALSAHVYEKGLKLSSLSKQSHTSGEIANYMTLDVERIREFVFFMHDIWVIPVQMALSLVVLYRVVGLATLATLATSLVLAAANAPLGKIQTKLQDRAMAAKDERMKAMSESLRNMRTLKLQAWEVLHLEKVENLRKIEYGWLRLDMLLTALLTFCYYGVPAFVAVATFGTCVLMGIPLTAGRVFTAVATFRTLQVPLISVPLLISSLAMARVSVSRLQGFLGAKEIQRDSVEQVPEQDTDMAVEIEEGTFSWDEGPGKPALIGINLQVQKGHRVAVCGTVGSGKSSLLSCILGEMLKIGGSVKVSGRTAYVAQSAWIQSGKIVDNILFGSTMDMAKYVRVLEACALREDLDSLPFGDQTEIGERGINLSGGQKQRTQIARALYQDADIYLLDDPFSAVDAHTGSIMFKECILGAMATKTVIYVTHQMDFLPAADIVLVIRDGQIVQAGKYEELLQVGTDFGSLVSAHSSAIRSVAGFDPRLDSSLEKDLHTQDRHITSVTNGVSAEEGSPESGTEADPILTKDDVVGNITLAVDQVNMAQLVQEEERESGGVTFKVYWVYLTSYLHGATVPFILLAQVLFQGLSVLSNWWLGWATPATESQEMKTSTRQLFLVFSALSLTGALFMGVRSSLMAITGIGIAQQFFLRMLRSIFRAPMSFFDSTPTDRILSRASSDQSCLDSDMPSRMTGVATQFINLIGAVVVLALVTREVLLICFPVVLVSFWLQQYYIVSARELSRLAGMLRSPVLHHYAESVAGAATVRGFGQEERFIKANLNVLDQYSRPFFNRFVAVEWLTLRFELLSNAVFGVSIVVLLSLPRGAVDPSMAGLAVTYGLTLSYIFSMWFWQLCALQNKIISVERIMQYTCIPSEAPLVIETNRPPNEWPKIGVVELLNLKVRYKSTSPLVLHGISCVFQGGHHVAIVGRTGSGKSTLIQALFRMVEPDDGKIVIDGVDIATIGLHDLRSKLSIIPQDPTLFEGDLRSNLDPLGQHSDAQLWETLAKCHLADAEHAKMGKLDAAVHENGENWSMGQRQLISLGRALLKSTRILILDEATASVDSATDNLMQKTIREEFCDCTIITVAHRIPTVIDSDKVLVLHGGRVAEYDRPIKLLADSSSMFAKLVSEYSQRSRSRTSDLRALARVGSEESVI